MAWLFVIPVAMFVVEPCPGPLHREKVSFLDYVIILKRCSRVAVQDYCPWGFETPGGFEGNVLAQCLESIKVNCLCSGFFVQPLHCFICPPNFNVIDFASVAGWA
jgi:hypothetical protein